MDFETIELTETLAVALTHPSRRPSMTEFLRRRTRDA
jgi:hypothetical protein